MRNKVKINILPSLARILFEFSQKLRALNVGEERH
jgi:hypothetical protein